MASLTASGLPFITRSTASCNLWTLTADDSIGAGRIVSVGCKLLIYDEGPQEVAPLAIIHCESADSIGRHLIRRNSNLYALCDV